MRTDPGPPERGDPGKSHARDSDRPLSVGTVLDAEGKEWGDLPEAGYQDGLGTGRVRDTPRLDAGSPRSRLTRRLRRPTRNGERVAALFSFLAVVGATAFLIAELHPGLLFGPGVDVGGDNGGHIAAPYFLIHNLLPQGRVTGWDPWWFDGFPLYRFYFPLPAILIAAGSAVFPYAVAFKLVTVLGSATLPVTAYAFGRLAAFRRPVPALMAVAMLPFLFNTSYTIDGGNIASTMAGEFSFSLAVSAGLLFLGVMSYALRTGRLRWLAAVLFAVTVLCHVVPALAFGGAALLLTIATLRPRAFRILVPVGVVGALLAAWWLLPFAADLQYTSSMGYTRVGSPFDNLLPHGFWFMLFPAALGGLVSLVTLNRVAITLGVAAGASVLAFNFLPSGLVYNARWLPFWFLFVCLLAAFGVGELFRGLGKLTAPSVLASVALVVGTLGSLVGSVVTGGLEGNAGFFGYSAPASHTQVDGWVQWNEAGIQARSGWGVFQGMVRLLDRAGRKYGCGRLQYEYLAETTNPFGSTEAMMSLPMWTGGCMQTTDGIYFESSTTTPFHFLNVAEVSQSGEAPNPISYLNYPLFNLADGVRHLQLMGVRYFLAGSPTVEADAAADPQLLRLGSTPGFPGPYNKQAVRTPRWVLYLVKKAPVVVPLTHLPEVESKLTKSEWLTVNARWYEQEQYWGTLLARSGPPTWPTAPAGDLVPPARSVPAENTSVTSVHTTDSSVSFHVSRTGTPVLVKVPYFPNWQAAGAEGPYEVSPNLMAVVPTSHDVSLHYGTTRADWAGKIASLAGVVGLGALMTMKRPSGAAPTPGSPHPSSPVTPAGVLPSDDGDDGEEGDEGAENAEHLHGDLRLSVVLPAHNEAELLESTVVHLHEALSLSEPPGTFELVVVENGSTDGTGEIAIRLARELTSVRAIRLVAADYGEALRTGFLESRGAVVVNFDVDYYEVGFLGDALPLIESGAAAIVLASKRAPGSADRRPLKRRLLTAGFTMAMRTSLGLPVSDAHGMKAIDRAAVSPCVAASEMGGSLFDVELVLRAHRAGLTIHEQPVQVEEIRSPRTPVWRRSLESMRGLVRLRWIVGPKDPA